MHLCQCHSDESYKFGCGLLLILVLIILQQIEMANLISYYMIVTGEKWCKWAIVEIVKECFFNFFLSILQDTCAVNMEHFQNEYIYVPWHYIYSEMQQLSK